MEIFIKKIKDSKAKPYLTNKAAITYKTESDQILLPSKIILTSFFKLMKSNLIAIVIVYFGLCMYPRHVLTFQDKNIFEVGKQLNDKHINLAQ